MKVYLCAYQLAELVRIVRKCVENERVTKYLDLIRVRCGTPC